MARIPAISLQGISLGYGDIPLFSDFSWTFAAGQTTCLLGPSGCGKSTLLKIVAGDRSLSYSGQVSFSTTGGKLPGISWMAQDDLLLPWLSVRDNISLGRLLRGERRQEGEERLTQLLAAAGLADHGRFLPRQLSGGMRQRVALLRTLFEDRPVLLMDEPFSALDALTRLKLQDLAADSTRGRTVLLVTHDPLEALRLADTVVVLSGQPLRVKATFELTGEVPRDPQEAARSSHYGEVLHHLLTEAEL